MNNLLRTSLLIVDDHPLVTLGLEWLLGSFDFIRVCGAACSAGEAMDILHAEPVDMVLLDINLPDMNGVDLCKIIKQQFPKVKVVALSSYNERSYILRMLDGGASGYLIKSASKPEIEQALKTVLEGRLYLSIDMEQLVRPMEVLEKPMTPPLTRREKEVLQLIAAGKTNTQIAQDLFISPLTVDSHRKNLLTKLKVHNTATLIRLAMERRLLD